MLELRHFRTLVAIEQTGKLSEAAARVHLTQSALSHQVRALEADYGPLFDRTAKGVTFTSHVLRLAHAGDGPVPQPLAGGRAGPRRRFP